MGSQVAQRRAARRRKRWGTKFQPVSMPTSDAGTQSCQGPGRAGADAGRTFPLLPLGPLTLPLLSGAQIWVPMGTRSSLPPVRIVSHSLRQAPGSRPENAWVPREGGALQMFRLLPAFIQKGNLRARSYSGGNQPGGSAAPEPWPLELQ